jgi:hypothetical protein
MANSVGQLNFGLKPAVTIDYNLALMTNPSLFNALGFDVAKGFTRGRLLKTYSFVKHLLQLNKGTTTSHKQGREAYKVDPFVQGRRQLDRQAYKAGRPV